MYMENYSCRLINFQRFCQCFIMLKISVFEVLKVTEGTVHNNNLGKKLPLQEGCLCFRETMKILLVLTWFNITKF